MLNNVFHGFMNVNYFAVYENAKYEIQVIENSLYCCCFRNCLFRFHFCACHLNTQIHCVHCSSHNAHTNRERWNGFSFHFAFCVRVCVFCIIIVVYAKEDSNSSSSSTTTTNSNTVPIRPIHSFHYKHREKI